MFNLKTIKKGPIQSKLVSGESNCSESCIRFTKLMTNCIILSYNVIIINIEHVILD